jgi:hypothetical protein
MTICPDCGRELPVHDASCPAGKKPPKKPFTIRAFLWENFRLFTMVGITGTMISLIPNMGTRILGMSWMTGSDNYLPLFLSLIILFGSLFLAICFLMIFGLIVDGRDSETVQKKVTAGKRTFFTWYEGDLQRFILLSCLVPMWFGMTMFFILLMPLIPNRYSWFFAAITLLVCIPLVIYSFLGWNLGKKVIGRIPGMERHPRFSSVVFFLFVIGVLVFLSFAIPVLTQEQDPAPADIKIKADPQYFSPQISSTKGMKMEITNITGLKFRQSRHTWTADYGYFIRVVPSTSEVTILGNPVINETQRDIYWTYSPDDPKRGKRPIKIDVYLYPYLGDDVLANSSLCLEWYTDDIVYVNQSSGPMPDLLLSIP